MSDSRVIFLKRQRERLLEELVTARGVRKRKILLDIMRIDEEIDELLPYTFPEAKTS